MSTLLNEDAIKLVIVSIKKLITLNKLEEALNLLDKYFSSFSGELEAHILLNQAQLEDLKDKITTLTISDNAADVQRSRIRANLLTILNHDLPTELEVLKMLGKLKESIYETTSEANLEKILGPINHMVKINWLEKGILAAKSVCQVLRADGAKGTGFVLKNGYLMTNAHVLPDVSTASRAKIIFNYEEDLWGNLRQTSEFELDANDSVFSPLNKLDYAFIKIKDNKTNPLSKWGFLELDTFSEPQIDNTVTIIQHPLGQTKQIALTANKIIGINGPKLLYMTDTERGSSGSPVFNNDWKVIALHHAGRTEEDGGLVIDPKTGEKRGANEGILMKKIVQDDKKIT
jgi:V8-like Glu-specific endopeptidase